MPDAALAFTAGGLVLLAFAVAILAVVFHQAPPPPIPAANHTPRRSLETERATVAHHRAEITQELAVIPQPRDGHSGLTVELPTLFARSRNRWDR